MEAAEWMTSRVTYVETTRAIAVAQGSASPSLEAFASEWPSFEVIEVSAEVAEAAAGLARATGLRSLDAVHLASAEAGISGGPDFACWDLRLRAAARARGFRLLPGDL